jgi:hypothetical protein
MSASGVKQSDKMAKKKGKPSRAPAISPIKYLEKLRKFFESPNQDDYFKNAPMDQVYGIEKRLFSLNGKIKPKLSKDFKYIPGLEGCSQLQNQWMVCAQNLATLEVVIPFLKLLFEDTKGILTNCALIAGCSWKYDFHPLDNIKVLTRQLIDLQRIFQHKYAYYRCQIQLQLKTAQIVYKVPRTIGSIYLNFCILRNCDTNTLAFRRQVASRHTQSGDHDKPRESDEVIPMVINALPSERPLSPISSDVSMDHLDCSVPGEEEVILPGASRLTVTIQRPEVEKVRKKKGKFHQYSKHTESQESSDSDSECSFTSARNSPENVTNNVRTVTLVQTAKPISEPISSSPILSDDEMSISEGDQQLD